MRYLDPSSIFSEDRIRQEQKKNIYIYIKRAYTSIQSKEEKKTMICPRTTLVATSTN